jgi:hypothetical protein
MAMKGWFRPAMTMAVAVAVDTACSGWALTELVPGIVPEDLVTPDQHGTGSRQPFLHQ